jgi:hypothetical protein
MKMWVLRWAWWHLLVIPALGKSRQEELQFQIILSSQPDLVSKKRKEWVLTQLGNRKTTAHHTSPFEYIQDCPYSLFQHLVHLLHSAAQKCGSFSYFIHSTVNSPPSVTFLTSIFYFPSAPPYSRP